MDKQLDKLLIDLSSQHLIDEQDIIPSLTNIIKKQRKNYKKTITQAEQYISHIRENLDKLGIESFFQQYGLNTNEGTAILTLAEALLRIPDKNTANQLIYDKLKHTNWNSQTTSNSKLLMASSIGIKIASTLCDNKTIITKTATPFIRRSIKHSMRILGKHFVSGETIAHSMHRAKKYESQGYTLSYDMLGESARSTEQAEAYLKKYLDAIQKLQNNFDKSLTLYKRPSVSIKLSALHPRLEQTNRHEVIKTIMPRIKKIITSAMCTGIPVTIDAEESTKLDLTLEIFTLLNNDNTFNDYFGIGIAVQAYHKHATMIIDYLINLATTTNRIIPIRLVKGAYWDTEIKHAQTQGLTNYPVFTQKHYTDISYLACAYKLLNSSTHIYPQFATHNPLTIAEIETEAQDKPHEFQLLHGMGKAMYDQIVSKHPCRIYAPVGTYNELLPYLIRRLIENAANTSFVKSIASNTPTKELIKDPTTITQNKHNIPLPADLYKEDRENSTGINLNNLHQTQHLLKNLTAYNNTRWTASPIIDGKNIKGNQIPAHCPYDVNKTIGNITKSDQSHIQKALHTTTKAFHTWNKTPVKKRALIIESFAKLLEQNKFEAIALCTHEAGKTIADSIDEIREAIDFCHYYSNQARKLMQSPLQLTSPTGETNQLSIHGRGTFLCISPWNFPLAIFLGQIVAALITGNTVIAKPAEQTPLIATFVTKLLYKAGLPHNTLALLPGDGDFIGKQILQDPHIAGVAFTGSFNTAKTINSLLAKKPGPIIPFIAETGGQNAMIVDSSILPEQTIDDILTSAFGSAGQRCSALRILYVQDEIADKLLQLLSEAMQTLEVGDPTKLHTNIGPVIDNTAQQKLLQHLKHLNTSYKLIGTTPITQNNTEDGFFIAPHAYEINSINELPDEIFGPILHIIRYKAKDIDKVIQEINTSGYRLTLGIQSRINSWSQHIKDQVYAGNIYLNRNIVGATVGVQPFGGYGLSGTGPKAGGPNYLARFTTEQTYTINTTAIGGNQALLEQ